MQPPPCVSLLDNYLASLKNQYEIEHAEDGCLLLTPLYLPDNTRLSIYCRPRPDGRIDITDDGETFDTLVVSGLNLSSSDRRLITIAARFGVTILHGNISKLADPADPAQAINDVIHAMLDIAYLVYTRQPRSAPNFDAEVEQRLIALDRGYDRNFDVPGRTAEHSFDFRILGRRQLLVDSLSTVSGRTSFDHARITAYKVNDIRGDENNPERLDYRFVCLIDDRSPYQSSALTPRALRILEGNLDQIIYWSDQNAVTDLLTA